MATAAASQVRATPCPFPSRFPALARGAELLSFWWPAGGSLGTGRLGSRREESRRQGACLDAVGAKHFAPPSRLCRENLVRFRGLWVCG
jgi:hypothetical protein